MKSLEYIEYNDGDPLGTEGRDTSHTDNGGDG